MSSLTIYGLHRQLLTKAAFRRNKISLETDLKCFPQHTHTIFIRRSTLIASLRLTYVSTLTMPYKSCVPIKRMHTSNAAFEDRSETNAETFRRLLQMCPQISVLHFPGQYMDLSWRKQSQDSLHSGNDRIVFLKEKMPEYTFKCTYQVST